MWSRARARVACWFDRGAPPPDAIVVNDEPPTQLPTATTCFLKLTLPRYRTKEELKSKLLLAVSLCDAIDTDFNVRTRGD